jgi:hypothetical protein
VGVGVAFGGFGVGVGVGSGVAVGGGSLGGGSDGGALSDGAADGSRLAGGQGSAATPEPDGDGIANDGITPDGSGVGIGKQVGDGLGFPHETSTITPHVAPYGRNRPL